MTYWLLVTHPANFEVMKTKNIAAMKARRKSYAERVEVGDKVVFYLTKIGKFAGAAEFKSKYREDKSAIFTEEKGKPLSVKGTDAARLLMNINLGSADGAPINPSKAEETHPWRFDVEFEVKLDSDEYISAEQFRDKLKYLKKWPAKYWKLGFQGNVHEIPEEDYETIRAALVTKG